MPFSSAHCGAPVELKRTTAAAVGGCSVLPSKKWSGVLPLRSVAILDLG